MTTHIPTIQELDRKGVRELHTIFRNAAEISANTILPDAERAAARKTQDNIRRVLAGRQPRP
jgi:hypothetical protein